MKHYCNRQNMRKTPTSDSSAQRTMYSKATPNTPEIPNPDNDRPIFPPGIDYSQLQSSPSSPEIPDMADTTITSEAQDDTDRNEARGGALSQMGGYERQIDINNTLYGGRGTDNMICYGSSCPRREPTNNMYYDNMSGSFALTSVPQIKNEHSMLPIASQLNKYINKYICLSLWTSDCMQEEICGYLTEIGSEFLTIRRDSDACYTMIDLKMVRYINIYCR